MVAEICGDNFQGDMRQVYDSEEAPKHGEHPRYAP